MGEKEAKLVDLEKNNISSGQKSEELTNLKKDLDKQLMDNARAFGRISEQGEEIAKLENKLEEYEPLKEKLAVAIAAKERLEALFAEAGNDKNILAEQISQLKSSDNNEIHEYKERIMGLE